MKPEPIHHEHPEREIGTAPDETDGSPQAQPCCPGCPAPLRGRSCKLRCLRCGYFEDCSNLI